MDLRFTHKDVLRIFPGIKARTLISWMERRLIVPFTSASGRGSSRIYSYLNLIEIGIVSEFLKHGIPFSVIEEVMTSPAVKKLKEEKDFDVVIFHHRQTPTDISSTQDRVRLENHQVFSDRSPSGQGSVSPGGVSGSITIKTSEASLPLKGHLRIRLANTTTCVKIDDFLKDGGRLLFGGEELDITSILVVNVRGIKTLVDRQLRGL